MTDERVAGLLAEPVHDLDDALGQPRLVQQVDEPLREERRVLGGLQHDGVAADERRDRASTPESRSGSSTG